METKRTIVIGAALAIAVSISLTSLSADKAVNVHSWPEHHGPGRTNISSERGLLKKWPEGGPPRLWTYSQCGRGYSGVTIAEGMIFTAGDFGRDQKLLALDMDGHFVWEARNGDAWRGASPGSRATPTLHIRSFAAAGFISGAARISMSTTLAPIEKVTYK